MLFRYCGLLWAVLALPALADGWRDVSLGGLDFQVPADWVFFYEQDSQAGGFSPDAQAFAEGVGVGFVIAPGPLVNQLPGASVLPGPVTELPGLDAVEVVTATPLEPGVTTRVFDLELPYAAPGVMLVTPTAQEAVYRPVFNRILASVTPHPGPMPPVPDPSGTWYQNGDADLWLEINPREIGIAFDVTAPGLAVELTRLDSTTLQVMSDGTLVTGTIDAIGQEVRWGNGGRWLRQPGAASAGLADGEPMSPAGVSVPLELGQVSAWVPALWPQAQQVDSMGRPFVTATAPDGEAMAHLVIIPGTASARMWQGLADAVTAGTTATDVSPEAPWTWARDAEGMIDLPAGEHPARAQLRAGRVGDGMAVLLVIWATDGNALTMDDASMIAAQSNIGEPPSVAAPNAVLGSLPSPAAPPTAALPRDRDILFDGQSLDGWQIVGSFPQLANGLRIAVPQGNGFAKEGLWSTRPLLGFDPADQVLTLRLRLDPLATTDFVLTLDPMAMADEWGAHDLRLRWSVLAGGDSQAALFVRQRLVGLVDVPGPAPEVLDLRLDRAGHASLLLPGGRVLEARTPVAPPEGWFLHVQTHAFEHGGPASLALTGLEVQRGGPRALAIAPFGSAKAGDLSLMDGTLGLVWAPLSIHGGDFARDARLDADGLSIVVPPNLGDAMTGLYTPDPVLWLEEFRDDAETTLTWTLDPARTSGFVLALSGLGAGDYPGYPPSPSLQFSFSPTESGGRAALVMNNDYPGEAWSATGPSAAPKTVVFRLTPGQVTIEAEGFDPVSLPWSMATGGNGLRLYAFATAPTDAPKTLALTSLILSHRAASQPAVAEGPAAGVAPLPMAALFKGNASPLWEPISYAGGSFDAFASYDAKGLRIDVPAGNSWGVTGLQSVDPILTLDARNSRTPARIEVDIDPATNPNFVLALTTSRVPDLWPDHLAWISLMPQPGRDSWALTLHQSIYSQWTREVSGEWMRAWDGRLIVETAPGWLSVRLPGGPVVRGIVPVAEGVPIYASLLAHAPAEGLPASLILRALRVGLSTPPGMSAADRWALLPDTDFNADDFLNDIAADLETAQ